MFASVAEHKTITAFPRLMLAVGWLVLTSAGVNFALAADFATLLPSSHATLSGHIQKTQMPLRPPGDIFQSGEEGNDEAPNGNSALTLRIDRLENQLRTMTGQLEQLQYQQHKMEEQLKRYEQQGATSPAVAAPASALPAPHTTATPPATNEPNAAPSTRARRSDAFEPDANPSALGAPQALGSENVNNGNAPIDLGAQRPTASSGLTPPQNSLPPPASGQQLGTAALTPRDEFLTAMGLLQQKQYESAEIQFKSFLAKYPTSRSAGDAVFYIGESFMARQRPREAAEQYIKLTTDYPKAAKAPDGWVRLGSALLQLDAKEQGCAAFGEVARKYPGAAATLKNAEREALKAHCPQ